MLCRAAYLCVEERFEQPGVFHLSSDVRAPQSESGPGGVHLKVALFAQSRQEAGAEPAAAAAGQTGGQTGPFRETRVRPCAAYLLRGLVPSCRTSCVCVQ